MPNSRLHIIIYILLLAVMLPGCGGTSERKFRIGVSQCSDDDWRSKMNDEIMLEMKFHPEAEVEILSANDDPQKQIRDIRHFIDAKYDIIIAAPHTADAVTPILREAYRAGIPVVTFDREMSDSSYTTHIEVDNYGLGTSAANYLLNTVPGQLRILEIQGAPGMSPTTRRHEGFAKTLQGTDARIIAEAHGDWRPESASHIADSLLTLHPDANVIYAHNDRMAIAAHEAAKRRGIKDITVIGIDGSPEIGIRAVADGTLDATFLYPTNGELIIRTAMDILNGKSTERVITIPSLSAVDANNADILLQQNSVITDGSSKINLLDSRIHEYGEKYNSQKALLIAILVILALLTGLTFILIRAFWEHKRYEKTLRDQNRLLEEERDKQRELYEELDHATSAKLVFFTNVSHDLRTPLTLISEPIDQLANNPSLTPEQRATLLSIANRNIKILRRLIDQVLDFRKYENGKLALHLSEVDPVALVREWTEAFVPVARRRSIHLTADTASDVPTVALDVDKAERVFFNLISNAFRHTPDNASITVSLKVTAETLTLKVSDTGEGIAAADLPRIFDRFFQVDKVHPKGSGIGLALTKAFVELHDGKIEVESRFAEGSTFTVTIPVRHVETTQAASYIPLESKAITDEMDQPEAEIITPDNAKPWLLVIDDNADIRRMISTLFADEYNVLVASNGKQGIRLANKYTPDLIICDMMMPVMDGLECVRLLKSELRTSHIPVLMLTACRLDEQRAESYESGADAYMSKPFNGALLRKRLTALIENRRRVAEVYRNPGTDHVAKARNDRPTDHQVLPGDLDNDFYAHFLEILDGEIANSELSVEDLATRMGLGQSQFSRKIKSLTNYTPVELIRRTRLKRAATLLTTTDMSISEIAYGVGFTSPAYFTKCYRDTYGETPTDVRNRVKG